MSGARGRLLGPAMVCLTALFVAFALTFPAWIGDGETLIGGGEQPDWAGTLWAWWWVGEALLTGQDPATAAANYLPVGQSPLCWYNLLDAFLFWPLIHLLGPVRGYNLAAVLILGSTGAAAAALARRAAQVSWSAALVGGLAVETSAWLLMEVTNGRLSQAMLAPFFFGLGALDALSRRDGGRGAGPLAGLLVAATALTYWFSGLFLLFGALPAWLSAPRTRARWAPLAEAALVTAACCGPFVLSLSLGWSALPGVDRPPEAWMDHGTAGRGLFSLNMVIDQSSWPLWPFWRGDGDPSDLRLPLTALSALVVGLLIRCRGPSPLKRWLLVGLIGWGLLLGPYLRDGRGDLMGPPLPYRLLFDHLPLFDRLWWPTRAMPLVLAALAVLSAAGVEGLAARLGRPGRWVALPLLVLLFAEVGLRNPYSPLPATRPREHRPALYAGLEGALITTPVTGTSADGRHALYLQVLHGRPISGGLGDHIASHRPAGYDAFIAGNGLLSALATLSQGGRPSGRVEPADLQALLDVGFRWVVVDPSLFRPGREGPWTAAFRALLESVLGPADREEARGAAWALHPIGGPVQLPEIEPPEPASAAKPPRMRLPPR